MFCFARTARAQEHGARRMAHYGGGPARAAVCGGVGVDDNGHVAVGVVVLSSSVFACLCVCV